MRRGFLPAGTWRPRVSVAWLVVVSLGLATPSRASAGESRSQPDALESDGSNESTHGDAAVGARRELDPFLRKPGYRQLFATTFSGLGLRFNNPYRLSVPLGRSAESVSLTAPYIDIGLASTFGNPLGLQHGFAIRTTFAVRGVGQVVTTPSYLVWRRWQSFACYGRAGVPIVATPDLTWGLEASVGGAWFFLGGIGLAAEVVGDVFYGAGTREKSTVTYPVMSGQLGVILALEVLP